LPYGGSRYPSAHAAAKPSSLMPPRQALLVVNPHSRRGAPAIERRVSQVLETNGVGVLALSNEGGLPLAEQIKRHAAQIDRVVVGGGDGTLNAAAPALLSTGLPLAIIPLGTANDLARTLGLPLDPDSAAQIAATGQKRMIDIGEVNGHPFFNVASIGFGVELTRALTRDSKRRFGRLGYAVAGLRVLWRLQPFRVEIHHGSTCDISHTVHVAIGNGRHYGGGMTIADHARIDDGQLDVSSLEVSSIWRLLRIIPALRSGRHHAWAEIRTLAGEEIEIRTSRPRSVNTDGEITTRTPARFRVLPGAVQVYTG
jgi:diacylglycerol kinase (ATP)